MVATYTTIRKTNRWSVVGFRNTLDISSYHALILHALIKYCLYRRSCLEDIGENLIKIIW